MHSTPQTQLRSNCELDLAILFIILSYRTALKVSPKSEVEVNSVFQP